MEVIVWLTALILITSVSQVVVSLQCLKSVLWLHTAYTTILHPWTLRVLSEGSGTNRLLWREFSNPIGIDIFYQIILCPEGLTCSLNASISPCHDTWKLLQILTDVHERANSLFGKHCGEWWSRIWGLASKDPVQLLFSKSTGDLLVAVVILGWQFIAVPAALVSWFFSLWNCALHWVYGKPHSWFFSALTGSTPVELPFWCSPIFLAFQFHDNDTQPHWKRFCLHTFPSRSYLVPWLLKTPFICLLHDVFAPYY